MIEILGLKMHKGNCNHKSNVCCMCVFNHKFGKILYTTLTIKIS